MKWQMRLAAVATALLAALPSGPDRLTSCLFSLPVACAVLSDGLLGGLLAALLSSAFLLAIVQAPSTLLICATLFALATVLGLAVERERRESQRYEKTAQQLSSVYEKVQAAFESMKRIERLSAIGQLSAGLAHEIRNPLASISGAASILQRTAGLEPKHAKCVEIIAKESDRLNGLLTNFLNFARPRQPRMQTVHVDAVLDSVLGLASHGVRGKVVTCEMRVAPDLPPVECDPEQLEQVLLNLMINAIEASPAGACVSLLAEADTGGVAIRVIDRGHGVAPAHVDRLFDPFFTTKEHGTGLGLPVAHQIVAQMGGALRADAGAERGMVFSVILPTKRRTNEPRTNSGG
jgi:signal transduction histidine kinase